MRFVLAPLMLLASTGLVQSQDFELGLPVQCSLGEDCFIQQFPDLAEGPDVADPWCGGASYDGHDGTDFRILSLRDVQAGTPVVASADGTVLGLRDGVPDQLVMNEADRAAVEDIECGNGVVLGHGGGWETQYCHMRQGSVVVTEGQTVERGDILGYVGASGLAQFPHVHLAVRKDGERVDPFTVRSIPDGCGMTAGVGGEESLWDIAVMPGMRGWEGEILSFGFAGDAVDYDRLVVAGPPPDASADSPNFVGWGWFINLRQGDEIVIRVETADGTEIAANSIVLDANKAAYAAFAGKRGSPAPGDYRMWAMVVRDGDIVLSSEKQISIE